MLFRCPVCNGGLIHKRRDDAVIYHDIGVNGDVTEVSAKSNGYDQVYCGINTEHQIGDELHCSVLDLVDEL